MTPEKLKRAIDKLCFEASCFNEHHRVNGRDGRLLLLTCLAIPWVVGKGCDDRKVADLIEKARSGDANANDALCFIAGHLLKAGKKLPSPLCNYVSSALIERSLAGDTKRGKGRRRDDGNTGRDLFIAAAVNELLIEHKALGLRPTRSREQSRQNRESGVSQSESACSIVHTVLERLGIHMTEASVEKIWRAHEARRHLMSPT